MNSLFLGLSRVSIEIPVVGDWAYLIFALLVAVEGPITVLAGAVAASAGYMNPYLVFVCACCGNLTADLLWYSIGYMGKTEWLHHYGRWFGIKEEFIDRLQSDIHTHIRKILFTAKLTLGFVIPTLVAAGLARVPFRRWFWVLFAGEFIWTGGLLLIGYHFGRLVQSVETWMRWVSIGGALAFLVVIAVYISRRRSALENE